MDLKEYLDKRKLRISEFSKISSLSEPAICNYLNGRRRPAAQACKKIQNATKNAVTFNDLMRYADKFDL